MERHGKLRLTTAVRVVTALIIDVGIQMIRQASVQFFTVLGCLALTRLFRF